ncbi:MAG: NADH-quinone oxidoreductase subunit C [FCB group bacterium]|jgi:NADH-quinone oxidoreductase subunit C
MSVSYSSIIESVRNICPELNVYEFREQYTLTIPIEKLVEVCSFLRDNEMTSFDMLSDVTAIDRLRQKDRFEIVYFLYSNKNKSRLRLKVILQEHNPVCPTITGIWESANWYERETFDMYGIKFEGHPDLRRFYMPEDYVDPASGENIYPLRKDFPLMGIPGSLPLPPYPEKYGDPK